MIALLGSWDTFGGERAYVISARCDCGCNRALQSALMPEEFPEFDTPDANPQWAFDAIEKTTRETFAAAHEGREE